MLFRSTNGLKLVVSSTTLASFSGSSGALTIDDVSGSVLKWSTSQIAIASSTITFQALGTNIGRFNNSGLYVGAASSPTARLHIAAGTATAGTAPIKLTSGTLLTSPENGAFEFDGSFLYFTLGGTRYKVTLTP